MVYLLKIPEPIYWTGKTMKDTEFLQYNFNSVKNWKIPPIKGLEIMLDRISHQQSCNNCEQTSPRFLDIGEFPGNPCLDCLF